MPRYFAFLRAINVGGHVVKMDRLRQIFESLGYANVETFIASGNIIFETRAKNIIKIESEIEQALFGALGYEVATYVRSAAELAEIARYDPFPNAPLVSARNIYVGLLPEPLDQASAQELLALRNESEDFHVHGREVYWFRRIPMAATVLANSSVGKKLSKQATFRGINTIRRLAAKYL